jgi:uncharacterized protein YjiS (DUF1127 family)
MMSTTHSAGLIRGRPVGVARLAPFMRILSRLSLAHSVYRERQALLSLDERGLRDIGVSRADAVREASRALWDIPERR